MRRRNHILLLTLVPGLLAFAGTSHESANAPSSIKTLRPQTRVPRKIGATRKVKIGASVPDFEMASMSGKPLSSKTNLGKFVVLIYVSANQRNSEAVIENAQQVYGSMDNPDLGLVFVTADFVHKAWFKKLWAKLGVEAPLGFDAGRKFHDAAGILALPSTLLIDQQGKLVRAMPLAGSKDAVVLGAYLSHGLGLLDSVGLAARLTQHGYDGGSQRRAVARLRAAARSAMRESDLEKAETELRQALEIDAIHIPILLDLAEVHLQAKDTSRTQAMIATVLSMDPRNRRARTLEGLRLFEIQDYSKAEQALQKALVLNPDPAQAHLYLGLACEKLGKKDEAILHLRKAAELYESKRSQWARAR